MIHKVGMVFVKFMREKMRERNSQYIGIIDYYKIGLVIIFVKFMRDYLPHAIRQPYLHLQAQSAPVLQALQAQLA